MFLDETLLNLVIYERSVHSLTQKRHFHLLLYLLLSQMIPVFMEYQKFLVRSVSIVAHVCFNNTVQE